MRYLVPLDDPRVPSFQAVRPRAGPRRVARWLAICLLLLAVALAVVPWQQTAFGEGQVVAYSPTERQQRIDAPVDGWLEEWFVQEGTRVRQGDPLVRIVDNDPQLLPRLQQEEAAVRARLDAAQQALETAQRNVRRQEQLYRQGLSARKQLEEAQLKVADVQKELAGAQAELVRIQTRVARQQLQLVTAPRDGVILRRAAGEGRVYVKQGAELALIVPETDSRAAELWVDGNDLPLLSVGREVRVQFEGWPALQFSGWPSVAIGTFGGRVTVIDEAQSGQQAGRFRLLVTPLPGEQWPSGRWLRQGVRVHGWVLLGTVPLGYELWRQFNDFPPSLAVAPVEGEAKKEEGGGK